MSELENCEDCGGSGVDQGSLNDPEPCPVCFGTGKISEEKPESRVQTGYERV